MSSHWNLDLAEEIWLWDQSIWDQYAEHEEEASFMEDIGAE